MSLPKNVLFHIILSGFSFDLSLLSLILCFFSFSLCVCVVSLVSDLQEEGKNAINAPMLPSGTDIHPEDTLMGMILYYFNLAFPFSVTFTPLHLLDSFSQ